jgi:hypothetical protein
MNTTRLATFIGLAGLVTAGCDGGPSSEGPPLSDGPQPTPTSWNALDWDPIDCLVLPDTPADVAQTPRERPDVELLASHLSDGTVAESSIYKRLLADLETLAALEPEAPAGYRARHDGRQMLIHAAPQTLGAMEDGSYSAWDCLNAHYRAEAFENRALYGLLRLEGIYEMARLGELYARLPGINAAEPNWVMGDGPTVYVTRVGDEWHYVADVAWGDCPAGCIYHVLYYFVSEPGGAVRYMDRWTVVHDQDGPSWVEPYWRKAETRPAPVPDAVSDAYPDFDRERARAEAKALLGRAESELQPGPNLRIVRRGDELFPVTMDLRPGRLNVELDDDGSGQYVVTRVVVEVPEGSIVVE